MDEDDETANTRSTYLLGGPADALLEPLGGEPHLDLLLRVLGGSREPGQLRLRGVGELVERRHERQVPVQRWVVLCGVEGHRDLRHLERHTEITGRFGGCFTGMGLKRSAPSYSLTWFKIV